jgi:hypothetical protein
MLDTIYTSFFLHIRNLRISKIIPPCPLLLKGMISLLKKEKGYQVLTIDLTFLLSLANSLLVANSALNL